MEGYPIPTDEAEFAADERKAIIEFDGEGDGQVEEREACRVADSKDEFNLELSGIKRFI